MTGRVYRLRLAAGAACLVTAGGMLLNTAVLAAASAAPQPGEKLGGFSLSANAPIVQVRETDQSRCTAQPAGTGACEGTVPETVAQLAKGPIGFALSSVVWPGTLAGNLGSTLILSGNGQVPPEAKALNSPVRAEARTGQQPSTVTTENTPPGTTMTASATPTEVSAAARIAGSTTVGVADAGTTTSSSRVALEGPSKGVAEAQGRVENVTLAAGVVRIASVTSSVRGSTDGTTSKATGSTTAVGVTVAGVPVTIDADGVHVAGQGGPLGKAAADAVNIALAALDMTITVSEPTKTSDGTQLTYTAGSLIFDWKQPQGMNMSVVLGGSAVSLSSAPAFTFSPPPLPPAQAVLPPPALPAGDTSVPATAPEPVVEAPTPAPIAAAAPTSAAAPQVAEVQPLSAPVARSSPLALFGGLSPFAVLLGLVGVGLLVAAMNRLPAQVLAPTAAPGRCPLEER